MDHGDTYSRTIRFPYEDNFGAKLYGNSLAYLIRHSRADSWCEVEKN